MRYALLCAACALLVSGAETLRQSAPPSPLAHTAGPTPTSDSVLEARTSAVAAQLRCPVCQGLSIQDSPSGLAQSMRAIVHDQLAQGRTPDEVKAYFVARYGEWILLAPKPRGFNLVAYLVPVFVVIGGGILIALAVRRWTGEAHSTAASIDAQRGSDG